MTSIIETIKAKIDVVEEVGLVVALQKSGKAFKGLCPFHNERSPSFYVFAETQTWHCFGCNEGGDIFTFVQKQQSMEFREALHYLAEKAGVPVEDESGGDPEELREASAAKERLRKLNEDAQLWFHQMLLRSKDAGEARAYVESRGIVSETVLAFGLGYAPDRWDALSSYLLGQGYTERELVMGGLAREREHEREEQDGQEAGEMRAGSGVYDYFRNRLIFPIRDNRGRVIGFGGRALGGGKPKYLNSPQTQLFEKNTVLYAIDMARDAIKQAGQVVIVEGYVDAVIAHQYGTKQTVACIGSAITEKHILQLKKLTRQVTLALDPDAAGSAATEQGIQEALRSFDRIIVPVPLAAGSIERSEAGRRNGQGGQGGQSAQDGKGRKQRPQQPRGMIRLEEQVDAEINVLQLPPGEDPDEVIRRDYSTWLYAVTHPLPLVDYYFVVKTAGLDLREPSGKAEATRRLLPVIATLSDRIKRDAYMRKLATLIRADERSLYEELQKVVREQRTSVTTAQFSAPLETKSAGIAGAKSKRGGGKDEDFLAEADGIREGNQEYRSGASGGQSKRQGVGVDRNKHNKIQWEDYLIGLLLRNLELCPSVCGIINVGDFAGTDTRELYHILNSVYQQRASSPSLQPVEQFVPPELLKTVDRAHKCVESSSPKDGAGLVKEAIQCATRLKRTRLLQLNTELTYLIDEAVRTGDSMAVRQLSLQLSALQRELRTIYSATHVQG
jgi:DNA primase